MKLTTRMFVLVCFLVFLNGTPAQAAPVLDVTGVCPAVANTPTFTIAYGSVTLDGTPAPVGTVVLGRSPRSTPVFCFVVTASGIYGGGYVYGEDTSVSPAMPGMRSGETVGFYVNNSPATATPALTWADDKDLHEINLAAVTLQNAADVGLTFAGLPNPVAAGETISYTANISNGGPSPATGVTFTDTLPGGLTWVSAIPSTGTCSGSGSVTCSLGTLAAGASATVTLVGRVSTGFRGSLSNPGTVSGNESDPTPSNNSATAVVQVNGKADLALTLEDAPDPVTAGQSLNYTLTVTNNGPSIATGVNLVDTLPGGVTLVAAIPSQGDCGTSSPITCTLGPLLPGGVASVQISVSVAATTRGTLNNPATVSATEPDPAAANNTVSAVTTVQTRSDLAVTVAGTPNPVTAGNNLQYTFTASNFGPSAANGVLVSGDLPAALSYQSGPAGCSYQAANRRVTCALGTLARGATREAQITVTVAPETVAGTLSYAVQISSDETDPNSANNGETALVSVTRPPKVTPGVTTEIHDASHTVLTSALVGATVHAQATVSGTAGTPGGTLDFTAYPNLTCSGTGTSAGTLALVSGVAHPGSGVVMTGSGLSFKAHYNGDDNYTAADGACASLAVSNPLPTLTALTPATVWAGSAGFTLLVTGTNFIPSTTIRWNGADLATVFISATQVSATIDAAKISVPGSIKITAFNPPPAGGESAPLFLTISRKPKVYIPGVFR